MQIYIAMKRILDIVLAIIVIVVLLPLMLLTAVLVKIGSKGPVVFKQERIGRNGKIYNIYKYRTMCVGAEKMGAGQYSFAGDTRITRVGHFLRVTSLDEILQAFNVLRGDMSFIGPRPPLTYHPWSISEYTERQRKRFLVRPGITGLAQINGRKTLEWTKRIEFDVEYVENLSLMLDIKIFVKTIWKVVLMKDNENVTKTGSDAEVNTDVKVNVYNK